MHGKAPRRSRQYSRSCRFWSPHVWGKNQPGSPATPVPSMSTPPYLSTGFMVRTFPKDAPIVPLTGRGAFQAVSSADLYNSRNLREDRTLRNPRPGQGNRTGVGRWRFRFCQTPVASLQAGNVIQNSLTALGNAAVGFEPRYDRCRCEGAWPRIRHAVVRNFITYGGSRRQGNTTSGHVICGSVWGRGDRRLVGT